jgi:uronate dehydrogenase
MKKILKKIIITGAAGRIGTILRNGLEGKYSLTFLDKKKLNCKNAIKIDIAKEFDRLIKIFKKNQVVIHLAWNNKEDFPNEVIIPENKRMAENIFRAAVKSGVKRVIIASSVHVDDYSNYNKLELISPERIPWPDSPYGATKIYIEALGRYFAKKYGVEVVCIRFGGVNPQDKILYNEDPNYHKVWLSSRDCINFIKMCIEAKKIARNFVILYGISNNTSRIHDVSNPFRWRPKDGNKFK